MPQDGNPCPDQRCGTGEGSLNALGCSGISISCGIVELDCLPRIIDHNHQTGEKVRSQSSLIGHAYLSAEIVFGYDREATHGQREPWEIKDAILDSRTRLVGGDRGA